MEALMLRLKQERDTMTEHRTKTYLMNWLKNKLSFLEAGDLNLSDDFKVEYRSEGNNWVQISIKDPTDPMPRYFEVKVTEKM